MEIAGALGFIAGEIETPDTWQVHVPPNLGDKITDAVLDWSLLLKALPELMAKAKTRCTAATRCRWSARRWTAART